MAEFGNTKDLTKSELELVRKAMDARKKAYAPYSKFKVGCALIDAKNETYSGCNVENSCFPSGTCAERATIFKMVFEGARKIKKIAVVTSSKVPVTPCGMWLQVISEFGMGATVISVNQAGTRYFRAQMKELYPGGMESKS